MRDRKKPLLLLDIDGVLNCFGDLGRSLVSFEHEFLALERYRIKVPLGAATALAQLSESFECVWATTWKDHAHAEVGVPLGLPAQQPWPHLEFDEQSPEVDTAKLPAVMDYVGSRAVAWVDDELHWDAWQWAEYRDSQGLPTLLVQPDPAYGLTPAHVQQLLEWADSVTTTGA